MSLWGSVDSGWVQSRLAVHTHVPTVWLSCSCLWVDSAGAWLILDSLNLYNWGNLALAHVPPIIQPASFSWQGKGVKREQTQSHKIFSSPCLHHICHWPKPNHMAQSGGTMLQVACKKYTEASRKQVHSKFICATADSPHSVLSSDSSG